MAKKRRRRQQKSSTLFCIILRDKNGFLLSSFVRSFFRDSVDLASLLQSILCANLCVNNLLAIIQMHIYVWNMLTLLSVGISSNELKFMQKSLQQLLWREREKKNLHFYAKRTTYFCMTLQIFLCALQQRHITNK